MDDEERIRRRAHELWEAEGRPEGRQEDHWRRAREEIDAPEALDAAAANAPRGQGNAADDLESRPAEGARERTEAVPDHAPGARRESGGGA